MAEIRERFAAGAPACSERNVDDTLPRKTQEGDKILPESEDVGHQPPKDANIAVAGEKAESAMGLSEFWEKLYGTESNENFKARTARIADRLNNKRITPGVFQEKYKTLNQNEQTIAKSMRRIMNILFIWSCIAAFLYGGYRWLFDGIRAPDLVDNYLSHEIKFEYQQNVRRSHEQFILEPMDLVTGLPTPTQPLKDLKTQTFRQFKDSFEYEGPDDNAYHGRLAYGFKHTDMPELVQSLDRRYPDYRDDSCKTASFYDPMVVSKLPSASVVIVFADEPFETLIRSIHSVLNRTPPNLLKEIVLVNDASSSSWVEKNESLLEAYLQEIPKVFLVKNAIRQGIMRSRTQGILQTTSDLFVVLDSHVEVQPGWLEPLVYRIVQEPFAFVTPLIDSINSQKNYRPQQGGIPCHLGMIWKLQDHAFQPLPGVSPIDRLRNNDSQYTSSPIMAGGLYAASKEAFIAVGGYDLGMTGWGAENVEMGFRLWMCGARLDCMSCSRVGHIFDREQTYKESALASTVGRDDYVKNRLRAAKVWMDEFAAVPHQIIGWPDWSASGDVEPMFQLRKNLQCKSFHWFLENIWPESPLLNLNEDLPFAGPIKSIGKPEYCLYGGKDQTIASVVTERDNPLNAAMAPSGNIFRCPWYLYFRRHRSINGAFDEETALKVYKNKSLGWDWNPDGKGVASRWVLEIVKESSNPDTDVMTIKSQIFEECLTISENGSIHLAECITNDVNQMWEWMHADKILRPTDFYEQWLIDNSTNYK